jgi:hypothetical protein
MIVNGDRLVRLYRRLDRQAIEAVPVDAEKPRKVRPILWRLARLIQQNVAPRRSGVIWSESAKASIVYSPLIRKSPSNCASACRSCDDANRRATLGRKPSAYVNGRSFEKRGRHSIS